MEHFPFKRVHKGVCDNVFAPIRNPYGRFAENKNSKLDFRWAHNSRPGVLMDWNMARKTIDSSGILYPAYATHRTTGQQPWYYIYTIYSIMVDYMVFYGLRKSVMKRRIGDELCCGVFIAFPVGKANIYCSLGCVSNNIFLSLLQIGMPNL